MAVAIIAKARTHHALCFTQSATRPRALDNQSDDEEAIGITQSVVQNTGLRTSPTMSSLLRTKLVSVIRRGTSVSTPGVKPEVHTLIHADFSPESLSGFEKIQAIPDASDFSKTGIHPYLRLVLFFSPAALRLTLHELSPCLVPSIPG